MRNNEVAKMQQVKNGWIEDFWILDEKKNKIIIRESKGKDNNIKLENVLDLELHRTRRGLAPEFPGLLIANTFNKARTLAEKDQRIPPMLWRNMQETI